MDYFVWTKKQDISNYIINLHENHAVVCYSVKRTINEILLRKIGLVLLILLIRLPILRIGNCGEHPKRRMKIRRLPETVLSKGRRYDIGSYSPIYIFSGVLTARKRKRKKGKETRKEKFVLQSSTEL